MYQPSWLEFAQCGRFSLLSCVLPSYPRHFRPGRTRRRERGGGGKGGRGNWVTPSENAWIDAWAPSLSKGASFLLMFGFTLVGAVKPSTGRKAARQEIWNFDRGPPRFRLDFFPLLLSLSHASTSKREFFWIENCMIYRAINWSIEFLFSFAFDWIWKIGSNFYSRLSFE